jgi:hypothetical protein
LNNHNPNALIEITMYRVVKYADCLVVFDLDKDEDEGRPLTQDEEKLVHEELPSLNDKGVASIFTDKIDCLREQSKK